MAARHDTNEELAARAARGDETAFERLMELHTGSIFAVGYARLTRPEDVEDFTQEVFLRCWLLLPRLRDKRAFTSWLLKMARNLASDWNRSSTRYATRVAEAAKLPNNHEFYDPRGEIEDRLALKNVRESLQVLPIDLREVALLHYAEDLSASEIARRLSVHPSTVGRKLDRAVGLMQSQLSANSVTAVRERKRHALKRSAAAIAVLLTIPAGVTRSMAAELAGTSSAAQAPAASTTLMSGWLGTKGLIAAALLLSGVVTYLLLPAEWTATPAAPAQPPQDPMSGIITGTIPDGDEIELVYSANPIGVRSITLRRGPHGWLQCLTTLQNGARVPFDLNRNLDFFMSYYISPEGPLMMDAILVEETPDGLAYIFETRTDETLGALKDELRSDNATMQRRLREEIKTREYYPQHPQLRDRAKSLARIPLNRF